MKEYDIVPVSSKITTETMNSSSIRGNNQKKKYASCIRYSDDPYSTLFYLRLLFVSFLFSSFELDCCSPWFDDVKSFEIRRNLIYVVDAFYVQNKAMHHHHHRHYKLVSPLPSPMKTSKEDKKKHRYLFLSSSSSTTTTTTTKTTIFQSSLLPQMKQRRTSSMFSVATHGGNDDDSAPPDWRVYIDQSKSSLEKGGSATLDAFLVLVLTKAVSSSLTTVDVKPAIIQQPQFLKKNKAYSKGPFVRCIKNDKNKQNLSSFDVTDIDSVDKVYLILTKHMQIKGISTDVRDALKRKYKGNQYLQEGEIKKALDAYTKGLNILQKQRGLKDKDTTNNGRSNGTSVSGAAFTTSTELTQQQRVFFQKEQGMILLMRSTAYLKRAANHKQKLKELVDDFTSMVSSSEMSKHMNNNKTSQSTSDAAVAAILKPSPSSTLLSKRQINNNFSNQNSDQDADNTPSSKDDHNSSDDNGTKNGSDNYKSLDRYATLANYIYRYSLNQNNKLYEKEFNDIKYYHGLYQYSLLYGAIDSLKSISLIPNYPKCYLQTGQILSELWKLKEASQYYSYAIHLLNNDNDNRESRINSFESNGEKNYDYMQQSSEDAISSSLLSKNATISNEENTPYPNLPSSSDLAESLIPVIDRMNKRQELLNNARIYGWSEDTLRLALDIAG